MRKQLKLLGTSKRERNGTEPDIIILRETEGESKFVHVIFLVGVSPYM